MGGMGLDIHVLVHPNTPTAWVDECLGSVEAARRNAGMPTALHVLPADESSIGAGRFIGYNKGDHPYVTSVDDDDWVSPNAFSVLHEAMSKNPSGIVTRFVVEDPDAEEITPKFREALRVFSRDTALSSEVKHWPVLYSWPILRAADLARGVVQVDKAVYHYRCGHTSNSMSLSSDVSGSFREKVKAMRKLNLNKWR